SVKVGDTLRYAIEVKDTKGQTARTQDFVVRIAANPAAADQQLANFDRTQDTFVERLAKLLGEQKKVKSKIDEVNRENAQLIEKLERIKGQTPAGDRGKPDPTKKPEAARLRTQLEPGMMKPLSELPDEPAN